MGRRDYTNGGIGDNARKWIVGLRGGKGIGTSAGH